MPASRSLTLFLALLLAPDLAAAAPRANAPAEAPRARPGTPPKSADRPARAPQAAPAPVPTTSKAAAARSPVQKTSPAPAATPVPKASPTRTPRPSSAARAASPSVDTGVRTPRTPRTAPTPSATATRTARAPSAARNDPAAPRKIHDDGTRTPRAPSADRTAPAARKLHDDGIRTPRKIHDDGTRTPRPTATQRAAEPGAPTTPAPRTSPPERRDPESHDEPATPRTPPSDDRGTPRSAEPTEPGVASPGRSEPQAPAAQPTAPAPSPAPVPEASPAPSPAPVPETSPAPPTAHAPPDAPVPEASPAAIVTPPRQAATTRPATTSDTAGAPVSKTSKAAATHLKASPPAAPATAKPTRTATTSKPTRLRPQREPLLARHPAASCELDPLEAVGQRQHGRTRDSLREFYWSDMARFFETTFDESEPGPRQADDLAFLPAADVIGGLPATVRGPLNALATARVVDRLSSRAWTKHHKLFSSLGPGDVAALLRADAPTLRAHVWTWLATTKTGGCHLGHIDLDFLEAAVADRSVAVEHGDDLVFRSLGDYALEARARLATLDPARFDTFLTRLTAATEVDPLVRATAHGILLRRAHWDTLDLGMRDPSASVRAATASAAIEMNRDKLEARLVEHAAGDPADLVTEQIVGGLLGVHDPHNHGRPQVRGLLANTTDERLTAAVQRWRGRGDALAPLPAPARPLKFSATPVPKDIPAQPAATQAPSERPVHPAGVSPATAAAIHAAEQQRAAPRTGQPAPERPVPGVLDSDDDQALRVPPMRP